MSTGITGGFFQLSVSSFLFSTFAYVTYVLMFMPVFTFCLFF